MSTYKPIRIRRGTYANLPDGGTMLGELRYATDIKRLFIDDGTNNVPLSFNWLSDYAAGTAYLPNDMVYYLGAVYVCILNSTGNLPTDTTYWELFIDWSTYMSSYISDTAYGASWDGVTTIAPSKNAVYDRMVLLAPLASPSFTGTITLAGNAAIKTIYQNWFIGPAGQNTTTGSINTAIGNTALDDNLTGNYNVAVGANALHSVTGSSNVGIGYHAGYYETGSSSFYVDNQNRTNTAGDKAKALMYGVFDAAAANQTLRLNATVSVNGDLLPVTSNGTALGTTALQFSDLFLAEGGVINWDNGDATLTQVGDVVTLAGADLKVTTPGNVATSVVTTDGAQTLSNKISIGIGTASPLGLLQVGEGTTTYTTKPALTVNRIINAETDPIKTAGFADISDMSWDNSIGYSAYTSQQIISGAINFNHTVSYQSIPKVTTSGTITNVYGFYSQPNQTAGTITNNYGMYVANPTKSGGTLTNNYGLYIAAQTSGTNNYAAYFAGNVGIANTAPAEKLDITGNIKVSGTVNGAVSGWTQTVGTFTASPASTSTITMTTNLTASILVGYPLKYVIGGVTYYGTVTAIAANLLTVAGAPLGGDVTALYYGDPNRVRQVTYDNSASTSVLTTGTVYTLRWSLPKAYLVLCKYYQTVADTTDNGKVTVKINGTETNTSAGGVTIVANTTWYGTVVDIATAAYDVNTGEDVTIVVTQGTSVDGYGLKTNMVFVTP